MIPRPSLRSLAAPLAILMALTACRQATAPATALDIEISHVAGTAALEKGGTVITPAGEALTVGKLQYYLSNLRLLRPDGSWWTPSHDPETADGYWLVDLARPESQHLRIDSAPAGEYTGLELLIGVDPARNSAGAQIGALDPALGMFWTWATGYIHFKLEGHSPASPEAGQAVTLHLGGDGVQRSVFLPFAPKPLRLSPDLTSTVHLHADLDALLGGTPPVSFARTALVMQAAEGRALAVGLPGFLKLDHLHHEPRDRAAH
ncbi:MAG: hypothetical protein NTW01_11615 [Gammaproteobacteria bacterium]|nr:hypothetical protein [Gammaproteobacteria bacterium]